MTEPVVAIVCNNVADYLDDEGDFLLPGRMAVEYLGWNETGTGPRVWPCQRIVVVDERGSHLGEVLDIEPNCGDVWIELF